MELVDKDYDAEQHKQPMRTKDADTQSTAGTLPGFVSRWRARAGVWCGGSELERVLGGVWRAGRVERGVAVRSSDRFRWVLWRVVVGGFVAHAAFAVVFALLGDAVVAGATAAALVMPAAAFGLLRWGRVEAAFSVACVDVVASAVLGTMFAGEGSGFLLYLLVPLLLAALHPRRSFVARWGWIAVLAAAYVVFELLWPATAALAEWSPGVVHLLHVFNAFVVSGAVVVMAVLSAAAVSRAERGLTEALGRMEGLALQDGLTGLLNRRAMERVLGREAARSGRSGRPYCVVMGDIDRFKGINDRYGHAFGDEVLRLVADCLRGGVRGQDLVGRWGGEEFLMVLPETGMEGASRLAERLRVEVEKLAVTRKGEAVGLSMTFGLASSAEGGSPEEIVVAADEAMYEGKSLGRNRVVAAK